MGSIKSADSSYDSERAILLGRDSRGEGNLNYKTFRGRRRLILGAIATLTLALFLVINFIERQSIIGEYNTLDINAIQTFKDSLTVCSKFQHLKERPLDFEPKATWKRTTNPRWKEGNGYDSNIVITNGTLWDGEGGKPRSVDIWIEKGLIVDITESKPFTLRKPDDKSDKKWTVIDANSKVVSPGIVDMHSHAGVDSLPGLTGSEDTNEWTNPLFPQVRSLDAFNPHDRAIRMILSGGVTTNLILPGSSNLMGGEAFVLKNRLPPSNSVEEMLINAGMDQNCTGIKECEERHGRRWRWMKWACGENPKRSFGGEFAKTPATRMGNAWLFRKRINEAKQLLKQQDEWCGAARYLEKVHGESAYLYMNHPFPNMLKDESLMAMLRNEVLLNVHCYESYDLETMIRIKNEFGFRIAAFHHALEAWQIADIIAREKIGTALFADNWGYKKEAYDASVHAPEILESAGVKVALKSDHPVTNAQELLYQAVRAHHYGLSAEKAFAAVTSVPADLMGVGWRIGRLKKGYDADIVIWDRNPMVVGASPVQILIDGIPAFTRENKQSLKNKVEEELIAPEPTLVPEYPVKPTTHLDAEMIKSIVKDKPSSITFKGLKAIYAQPNSSPKPESGKVVIESGIVSCVGAECPDKGVVVDMNGTGVVTPAFFSAFSPFGLVEIAQESSTKDGAVSSTDHAIHAADGIRVGGSRMVDAALRNGVLFSITAPISRTWLRGVSTLVDLSAEFYDDAISQRSVALHVNIGHEFKMPNSPTSTISGQIDTIRRRLIDSVNSTTPHDPFQQVIQGKLPLAVNVHSADDILRVLELKSSVEEHTKRNFTMVIIGGAEAWMARRQLSKQNVGVVLVPSRCMPATWEMRRCRSDAAEILKTNNVSVGLGIDDMSFSRNVWYESAVAYSRNTFSSPSAALSLTTSSIATMFKLPEQYSQVAVGYPAKLNVFEGDPMVQGLQAQLKLVVSGKKTFEAVQS